jgi:hypothetical protein
LTGAASLRAILSDYGFSPAEAMLRLTPGDKFRAGKKTLASH